MNKRPTLSLKAKAAPAKKPATPRPPRPANRADAAPKADAAARPPQPPRSPDAPSASPWNKDAIRHHKPREGVGRPPLMGTAPAPQGERGLRPSYHRDLKPALQTEFKAELKADSLAFALLGAATAVVQVRGGMALPQALTGVFGTLDATPQGRGAIQDIAYRAMRQLGRSDALVGAMTEKAPEPLATALLACALPLMQLDAAGNAPYEAFTVVDQAVTAAGSHPDTARAKGMVNALLRRFLRERDALLASVARQPVARWNYPQWWIDAAVTAYPQDWQRILAAGDEAPPLTLRVNARKSPVDDYLAVLAEAGIGARRIGPHAVRLDKPMGVHGIPGFDAGIVSVQDAAAQLAAPLLDVQDGMRVLDACAAPGGKTCHILELADAHVTALDADPRRLARVGENLERLGLSATLQAAEAQTRGWWDGEGYDRILADVPCTASGIVRRHPDIRWLRRKADTLQLATLSGEILDNLWQMLRPNGKLLFVTCSLWPQESEAQAAAFAVRNGATRLDAPGQLLPVGGAEQDHDGLFYALFQKVA
ncbi:ribosomal RNA small subunit methyltransferase B [Pseudoduganella plicata]|uniref:16S rRNA (Cytosine(967)-C(5))-methyltransferase RsmB n=2 Tax=Pseudoduganella plicata TaxID=321984 RepID=A0A4P7BJ95_9BURK|nr:16S rRNA (cytosine(967)-C(5))-methyltransferase RsmB [Pseudoduganella plicata]GGY80375.1 ribosomal RNA small subunit methyltransferase B [Pseudoduganella plicata]